MREWIVTEKIPNKPDTNKPTVYASPTPSLQQQLFQQTQVQEIRTNAALFEKAYASGNVSEYDWQEYRRLKAEWGRFHGQHLLDIR